MLYIGVNLCMEEQCECNLTDIINSISGATAAKSYEGNYSEDYRILNFMFISKRFGHHRPFSILKI